MIKAGIIGASGFAGHELVKILSSHPDVSLEALNSMSYAGKKVSSLYPDFDGGLSYSSYSADELNRLDLDCIFLATPNGAAAAQVPMLECKKIIDLSADFRFKNLSDYEAAYAIARSDAQANSRAVYGLPELFRDQIKQASLVGNPGCYATASTLAAFPIHRLANYIVFDCKSGWSGAGRESAYAKDPSLAADNVIAYKLASHRHAPEIKQFIKTKFSFTPHVIGAFRGMMCTAHILLGEASSREDMIGAYKKFYASHPFVKIIEDRIPAIKDVALTNYCLIGGFEIDQNNQLVVVSVIDNLLKGASGQAVQNMNLMLGLEETKGLSLKG